MSVSHSIAAPRIAATSFRLLCVCLLSVAYLPLGAIDRTSASAISHLVVSEVSTGGTSASDELIELYNPTAAALPLEGLELVYVSASGATVSRRAAWELGAPEVPAGAHLLVANELGSYAAIADATYASGIAATGGSVALRIQGASIAIDAVGWGTAAGTWLEGGPAAAPPAGGSLERLPGGSAGSTVDTDDNAADFTVRPVPDPQNSGSPPVPDPTSPSPTPTPLVTPSPMPAPTATPVPSTTPPPAAISISDARALPDGSAVTVEGSALTASDFTDGGGYLADPSGGIAVLVDGGAFARGDRLTVRGTLDDRFAQRTIRASAADVTVTGSGGVDPAPLTSSTGAVAESTEGRLIRIAGTIDGSPTPLSGGLAFDVDDGSGAVRVVVGSSTGIDTATWANGAGVIVTGVVGQRDSTGTGSSGYRVQPRDAADIAQVVTPSPTASTAASPDPDADPTPTPSPVDGGVITIADARAAAKNARVTVRGVVTLASGSIDPGSAVIQDASGAILLRLGDEAGPVSRGDLLQVAGVRSTKGGMASLRVTVAPSRLGSAPDPAPRALRTGDASEASEAQLVLVRGSLAASARRASSGTVSFEIDDGSGSLRIVLGAALEADDDALVAGTWLEVAGVLGQETTGAQPLRGYRVWPRGEADLRVLAGATDGSPQAGGTADGTGADGGGSVAGASLAAVGEGGLADIRVGATLVAPAWPELGVGGLLWDGERLVGITPASGPRLAPLLDDHAAPVALELTGLREERGTQVLGLALVSLGATAADTVLGSAQPDPPSATMPGPDDPPAWISVVGRVTTARGRTTVALDGRRVAIERQCRGQGKSPEGTVSLLGIAVSLPPRIIVGCQGFRPAPALALVGRAPSSSPARATVDADADGTAGRRLFGASVLAIAAGMMVSAVVLGRRFGAVNAVTATSTEPPAEDAALPGPQLTLVRLPNEHGP